MIQKYLEGINTFKVAEIVSKLFKMIIFFVFVISVVLTQANDTIDVECLPGFNLGDDGYCYMVLEVCFHIFCPFILRFFQITTEGQEEDCSKIYRYPAHVSGK